MSLFGYDNYPGYPAPALDGATAVYGTTNSGLPGASDNPGNWLDNWFTSYEPYPAPYPTSTSGTPGGGVGISAVPAGSNSSAAAAAPPAATNATPPVATIQPMLTSAATPAISAASMPGLQRSYCYSPEFRGEREGRRANGEHITHDAQPVTFTVPAGCNALDLWFGPIEPSPGARAGDFQHVIQTGKARIVDAVAGGELDQTKLTSGQQVAVIVPWRTAATAKVDAGHLRTEVMAQFYVSATQVS